MAVQGEAQSTRPAPSYTGYEAERGEGWILFAGVLLLTLGVFNMVDGIAAISRSHVFAAHAHYVFGDLRAWGWTVLFLGVLQILVGLGIFARNQLARWTGVVVLSLNALAQLFMMPSYTFWALAVFAIDIVAIYGLVAYGNRIAQ